MSDKLERADDAVEGQVAVWADKYGISSPLARVVDVLSIIAGGFALVYGAAFATLGQQLAVALGVILVLGGVFGFINNLGGDA